MNLHVVQVFATCAFPCIPQKYISLVIGPKLPREFLVSCLVPGLVFATCPDASRKSVYTQVLFKLFSNEKLLLSKNHRITNAIGKNPDFLGDFWTSSSSAEYVPEFRPSFAEFSGDFDPRPDGPLLSPII